MNLIYLLITLSILCVNNNAYAACFARCCGIVPEQSELDTLDKIEKRNKRLPTEVTVKLHENNTPLVLQRFIDREKNLLWKLDVKQNNCVTFEKSIIKQSDDQDPLTWMNWPVTPLRPGIAIVTLSCICKNKILQQDEITIHVID